MNDDSETARPPTPTPSGPDSLPPADFYDPVIEAYKKDVDRTLLRENLKLTPSERLEKFEQFMEFVRELRATGAKMRARSEK